MSRLDQYSSEIEKRINAIRELRRQNQSLRRSFEKMGQLPEMNASGSLADELAKILPPELMPSNVGHIDSVSWFFHLPVNFQLGANPTLSSQTRFEASVQVSQEAAFVMTGISRSADDYSEAGDLGPLQIEIRDRSSSRFFNNFPIPIQHLGRDGRVTRFPTGLLIMPNSFIDLTLTSWLAPGVNQATLGSGNHQFTLWGWRIRTDKLAKAATTIFE